MSEAAIETKVFGSSSGGGKFGPYPVSSIGIWSGVRLDALEINGIHHGGNGGGESNSLILSGDEYIKQIVARTGEEFDHVKFITNKDRTIEGGGPGGSEATLPENSRVLLIGGNSGALIDKLRVTYIKNYSPSETLEKNANFIFSYTAPGTIQKTYTEQSAMYMESYEHVSKALSNYSVSANASAEFFGRLAGSSSISASATFENIDIQTVATALKNELSQSKFVENDIPEDCVGVQLGTCDIMKDPDGHYWFVPTSEVNYAVLNLTDYEAFLGHYDLTGTLSTQIPKLVDFEERDRFGMFTYYKR